MAGKRKLVAPAIAPMASAPAPAPPPTPAPTGLSCKGCGCRDLRVVDSRPGRGDSIVRTRECRHCCRRLHTRETAAF